MSAFPVRPLPENRPPESRRAGARATRRTPLRSNGSAHSDDSRSLACRLAGDAADLSNRLFERVSAASPRIESPGKGTDAGYASVMEKLRRTGAAGLVRSGAVKHDVAIFWDLAMPLLDLFWCDMDGAGQPGFVRQQVKFVAEVDNEHVIAG